MFLEEKMMDKSFGALAQEMVELETRLSEVKAAIQALVLGEERVPFPEFARIDWSAIRAQGQRLLGLEKPFARE
jgi:hypothetical protein